MKRHTRLMMFAIALVIGVGWVAGATRVAAQTATSTLTGTVVDGTGAVVPGASVTATHVSTTTVRTGTSNDNGLFRLPALAPGEYSVVVELSGFKSVTVQQIQLVSSETRDLGKLALEVGAQAENVTVTADVTPISSPAPSGVRPSPATSSRTFSSRGATFSVSRLRCRASSTPTPAGTSPHGRR